MLRDEAHRLRKPFKHVVNEALRRGLSPDRGRPARRKYRVQTHRATLLPGFDPGRLNALADQLEDEALVRRLGRRRRS
jgi:hypothetical protein